MRPISILIVTLLGWPSLLQAATFEDWVYGLVVSVPPLRLTDIHIPLLGDIVVNVTGGQCSHLIFHEALAGNAYTYNISESGKQRVGGNDVWLTAKLGLSCNISADVFVPLLGRIPAIFRFGLHTSSGLDVTFSIATDMNETAPLPESLNLPLSACHVELNTQYLRAELPNKFVENAFNSFIELLGLKHFSELVSAVACPLGILPVLNLNHINQHIRDTAILIRKSGLLDPAVPLSPPSTPTTPFSIHDFITASPFGEWLEAIAVNALFISDPPALDRKIFQVLDETGILAWIHSVMEQPFTLPLPGINITGAGWKSSTEGFTKLNGTAGDISLALHAIIGRSALHGKLGASLFDFNFSFLKSSAGPLEIAPSPASAELEYIDVALEVLAYLDALALGGNLQELVWRVQHLSCVCDAIGPNPWTKSTPGEGRFGAAHDWDRQVKEQSLNAKLGSLAVLHMKPAIGLRSLAWELGDKDKFLKPTADLLSKIAVAVKTAYGQTINAVLAGGLEQLVQSAFNAGLADFTAPSGAAHGCSQVQETCPAENIGDVSEKRSVALAALIVAAFSLVVGCIVVLVGEVICRRGPLDSIDHGYAGSLAFHPCLPRQFTFAIPALQIIPVALFIAALSTWFIDVRAFVWDGTGASSTAELSHLTLWGTLGVFYSTSPALAIGVGAMCLFWPYLRLALVVVMWLAPAQKVSIQRRELVLAGLDVTAKVSLLDNCILLLTFVAAQVMTPNEGGQVWPYPCCSGSRLHIGATVPEGYICQGLATGTSIILGHIALTAHRHAEREQSRFVEQATLLQTSITNFASLASACRGTDATMLQESLASGAEGDVPNNALAGMGDVPSSAHISKGQRMSLAHLVGHRKRGALTAILCSTFLLTCVGVFLVDIVVFEWGAFYGEVRHIFGMPNDISYSVWDFFIGFFDIFHQQNFATFVLGMTLTIFAVIIPFSHIFVLLVLWICPLHSAVQYKIWMVSQVLLSWGALDVFVLALTFTWLLGDAIDTLIQKLASEGTLVGPLCAGLERVGTDCVKVQLNISGPVIGMLVCTSISCHLCHYYVYLKMSRVRDNYQIKLMESQMR